MPREEIREKGLPAAKLRHLTRVAGKPLRVARFNALTEAARLDRYQTLTARRVDVAGDKRKAAAQRRNCIRPVIGGGAA